MLRQYAKERQIHLWKQQFIITSSGLIRQMQHNAVYKLITLLQSQMCSQQLMATKQFIAPWLGAQPSMFVNRETKQNPISDATINHQLLPRQSSTHPHTSAPVGLHHDGGRYTKIPFEVTKRVEHSEIGLQRLTKEQGCFSCSLLMT